VPPSSPSFTVAAAVRSAKAGAVSALASVPRAWIGRRTAIETPMSSLPTQLRDYLKGAINPHDLLLIPVMGVVQLAVPIVLYVCAPWWRSRPGAVSRGRLLNRRALTSASGVPASAGAGDSLPGNRQFHPASTARAGSRTAS